MERHSRESEREGPREALRPASLAGGGSLEKHTTMAVTLSTDFMSRLDCTCTARGAAERRPWQKPSVIPLNPRLCHPDSWAQHLLL